MSEPTTRMFNGSTFTFGSAVARLEGISYTIGGVTVDVTEPEDALKLYEVVDQPDMEITVKVKRLPTIARGDTGAAACVWADGSTDDLGSNTWVCTDVTGGGDRNQPLAGTIKFKPTLPAA